VTTAGTGGLRLFSFSRSLITAMALLWIGSWSAHS
jgi:hypothetical protein